MAGLLRSALFVPADKPRALAKAAGLEADAVILDLEDAVAPPHKDAARAAALKALRQGPWTAPVRAVRINALSSAWGGNDVLALAASGPDALVIPKVESAADVHNVRAQIRRALGHAALPGPHLWAMVETPQGILKLEEIAASAAAAGLTTLVFGANDLATALHCDPLAAHRQALLAHLSRLVLVARSFGLRVLDGVYNAFEDAEGFAAEARQGKTLGFDGKTLIHPAQIAAANAIFGPTDEQIKQARVIVRAFALKKNAGKGAINLNGQMVERLHLENAKALLDSLPAGLAQPRQRKAAPKRKTSS